MPKPFKKLLLKLILEQAVIFEEHAYRFYEGALKNTVMDDSRNLLNLLMKEELKHRIKLEKVQKKGDLGGFDVTSKEELDDIEAVRGEWPYIGPDTTREEILRIALTKEKSSYAFYRTLARKSRIRIAGELFNALSNEELQHVRMIEEQLT